MHGRDSNHPYGSGVDEVLVVGKVGPHEPNGRKGLEE